MGFKDKPYKERWKQMGDLSEQACRKVYNQFDGYELASFGWDRATIDVSKLSDKYRYMPDYIATCTLMGKAFLIECVGLGRDGLLKFKLEKIDALLEWAEEFTCVVFIYDSSTNKFSLSTPRSMNALSLEYPTRSFPEGKLYAEIPKEAFAWRVVP